LAQLVKRLGLEWYIMASLIRNTATETEMKVVIKKGSPRLAKYLNKGGFNGVKGWVHNHTNYEAVYSAATRKHGYNSPAFFDAVREVGALGREGLKNNGHIAALEAWLEEHLGRG
jgi:hypothetical protein